VLTAEKSLKQECLQMAPERL